MYSRSLLSCSRSSRQGFGAQCRRTLATVTEAPGPAGPSSPPKSKTERRKPNAKLSVGVVLNRSPIISRTPTPFERAYYAYHTRIQRALFNPFPVEFYFKQGSLLEAKFDKEEAVREKEAFGGPSRPASDTSVDSSTTGSGDDVPSDAAAILSKEDDITLAPRAHEADVKGDVKSLDRQGERNLYLLIKGKDAATGEDIWKFPEGGVKDGEQLHDAAQRDLFSAYGAKMDTWVVSGKPLGVYQASPAEKSYQFFVKAHVMAGQVHPDGKKVVDFAWLTKQEIQPRVSETYWSGIKDMLADF